ncbi:MAG: ATP-binding cassette domain-containing protein, partial [Cyanobacteria bacterium J06635_13]
MTEPVIDVRHLRVEFATENKPVVAVEDLTFRLHKGEKLGIVGESGSGKSVTSLAIMGLVPTPGRITQGEVLFTPEGKSPVDLLQVNEAERRSYRGGKIAMIFQEPMSALNPVYNIGFQITEAILLHQKVTSADARRKAIALLQEVQLLPSDEALKQQGLQENPDYSDRQLSNYINQSKQSILKRYPHELSGGQLQRVTIAMAISCNPAVLIADEPTTALDVTVQATILDLLRHLCQERGMALIFITHDLGVIAELVDSVAVMYRGKVVETGNIKSVFQNPQHPYTKGLLACRPSLERRLQTLPTVVDFMDVATTPEGEIKITEKQGEVEAKLNQIVTEAEQKARLEQLVKQEPLMSVKELRVGFPMKGVFGKTQKYIMAVNNVSFAVLFATMLAYWAGLAFSEVKILPVLGGAGMAIGNL